MKRTFVSFLLSLLFFSCKKSELQGLPPYTQSGQNVVAFKVNGRVVVVSGHSNSIVNEGVSYSVLYDSILYLDAVILNPHVELSICAKIVSLGAYPIISSPWPLGASYFDDSNSSIPGGNNQFNTDSSHSGMVTYNYRDANIFAGTFAFDVINSQGTVIHITEGRFDIKN